jgi:hypothetical protein
LSIHRFALIIGAMKSGTTTLFNYLAQHPAIAAANQKEPAFFAFDDIFEKGRDWYENLFCFAPGQHQWALDGSTDIAKAPFSGDVRARMAALPDAEFRLIYILRHPLRRMESHARHAQIHRMELGVIASDRPDHGLDNGISPVSMAASQYAAQLDRYRDLFDAGKVMLLSLEQLSADPKRQVARICQFLELPSLPTLRPAIEENRAEDRRESGPLWDNLRKIPGLAAIIPKSMRHLLYHRLSRRPITPGRFRLTPAEETALLGQLLPDLRRLRDIYGFDVEGQWGIVLDPPDVSTLPTSPALP